MIYLKPSRHQTVGPLSAANHLLFVIAHIFATGLVSYGDSAANIDYVSNTFIRLHAYSRGGGTYIGIEAVSNGLQLLGDAELQPAKKHGVYGHITGLYRQRPAALLFIKQVSHEVGKTISASLFGKI